MRISKLTAATLLGLTMITIPVFAQDDTALTARLDAVIDKAIADQRIVGTVVLVARDGEVIYRRAAGLADREQNIPMQEDAIFRYASITKPFVSATLMKLVEDGRVSLSDPVTKWLPDFQPSLADGVTPEITLEELLTHTAGLSYNFLEPLDGPYHQLQVSDGGLDQPGLSLDENLKRLAQADLMYAPGEGWLYSLSLDVLGGVIEKVTGETLPEAVEEAVTGPLGLDDAKFSVSDLSRLVTPYADGTPEPVLITDGMNVPIWGNFATFAPSRILNEESYPSGGGGMAGTADDLLTFLETIRTGGGEILAPETVALMMQDQVGAQAQTQGPGWGFGYGWAVLEDPAGTGSPQSAGTIAWGGAYGHTWFVDPKENLTVVSFTNTTFEGINGAYPVEIRDAIYQ